MPIQAEIRNTIVHDDEKCYCKDTILHLRHNEEKYYVLTNDTDLTDLKKEKSKICSFYLMRQRLIEWLIIVQDYYSSSEETLEMSIRLFDYIYFNDLNTKNQEQEENNNTIISNNATDSFDLNQRIMSEKNSFKEHCICGSYHNGWLKLEELQLVALACFFLACKFWERFPPKISKLINFTEYGYSEQQLFDKEKQILSLINFDLKIPLVTQYLEFYMLHERHFLLNKIIPISHYLYNLTLTETRFLNRLASSLAAVILTLAKTILCSFSACNMDEAENIHDYGLFKMKEFSDILNDMWLIFYSSILDKESFKLQKKKFSDQKYSYLPLYIESVDISSIHEHYNKLKKNVNKALLNDD